MTLAIGRSAVHPRAGAYSFSRRIVVTDALVVTWAVFGAYLLRFGVEPGASPSLFDRDFGYVAASVAISVLWMASLRVHGAYDDRLFGYGPEEYRAVITATLRLFVALAVVSYLFKLEIARGYLLVVLPAGLVGLVVSRWLWRRWLGIQRSVGRFSDTVIVVGDKSHLASLVADLRSVPSAGYRIVGACCATEGAIAGVPVLGTEEEAVRVATSVGADVIACSGSTSLGAEGVRRLGWQIEGTGIDLVLAPSLTQVAGPRIMTRPVAGLPLLHVEAPIFSGPKRVVKRAFDIVAAGVITAALSPVLIAIAVLVRRDGGPALYRQSRIGIGGKPFEMVKFRSMIVDADRVTSTRNDGAGPLFKLKADPRVTPLGAVLRRFSLDELPQLWNVMKGEMSLVGPRPALAREVDAYEQWVDRRLLVPPGMTGLWQVSGRSDLAWEDAVRLDLFYVENWNLVEDLKILWRTGMAVVRPDGAY